MIAAECDFPGVVSPTRLEIIEDPGIQTPQEKRVRQPVNRVAVVRAVSLWRFFLSESNPACTRKPERWLAPDAKLGVVVNLKRHHKLCCALVHQSNSSGFYIPVW